MLIDSTRRSNGVGVEHPDVKLHWQRFQQVFGCVPGFDYQAFHAETWRTEVPYDATTA
jgi:hypothetical protein